jgi:hypothetical protein
MEKTLEDGQNNEHAAWKRSELDAVETQVPPGELDGTDTMRAELNTELKTPIEMSAALASPVEIHTEAPYEVPEVASIDNGLSDDGRTLMIDQNINSRLRRN